jgi:hypothetical protein
MHSALGVGHFVVQVLIWETEGVGGVMLEVVHVHVIIVQEHASVEVLGEEVEANIVDVSWHEFIDGELLVSPVGGKGQREVTSLKNGHLALKILIVTSVVVLVSIADSDSGGGNNSEGVAEASPSESLL